FSGGMIPSYLLMSDLHLLDTLWAVILPLGIDVYNLVLMRNFFEGIPISLFEAAEIDGCTPLQIFYKVVLPLSKAAIASIGLMFAVKFWNDYTNFKLYIPSKTKYQNFQMKLRGMIFGSETGNNSLEVYSVQTIQSAVVIIAVIPFMILYPFCQNYFVQGVNVGAVKE
ncbi:MAG TPA: carbohydrate ABC transporter permease, partial [Eubacterium sp.]|nr:carbohydrate ABC transporter permease [Eubacterium sp.]